MPEPVLHPAPVSATIRSDPRTSWVSSTSPCKSCSTRGTLRLNVLSLSKRFASILPLVLTAVVATADEEKKTGEGSDIDQWRIDVGQGAPLALALPELEAETAEAKAVASEISRTLFDDISFASVFKMVDPDKYALVAKAGAVNYHGWESIGADVTIIGTVAKSGDEVAVTVRIHDVVKQKVAFQTKHVFRGSTRVLAHHISDRILQNFGLLGVARTRIVFASDRASENKLLFLSDYDGFGVRQATQNRHLDFQPRFSPDGSTLSFISYPKKNAAPVLAILNGQPVFTGPGMIFSASWSPDATHIAFASSRDEPGNAEIYVMRRNGSDIRRLTHHPGIDVSPTWSPTGRELAFTSDRAGSPQIYAMDAEGLNLRRISMKGSYNAEPAWSPSKTFSEIAYATRVRGSVFNIVRHDLLKNEIHVLTHNHGLNESPQWAPNGRHLVFTSTRTGTSQIFTMNRDGSNLRQLTSEGQNTTPSWGPAPPN
jgi:TolB protein